LGVNGQTYTTTVASNAWSLDVPAADVQAFDASEIVTADVSTLASQSATQAVRSISYDPDAPVAPTVNPLVTNINTPVISGVAILNPDESVSVTVNGVTYTDSDPELFVASDAWTVTIPMGAELADNVYDVVVTVIDDAGNETSDGSIDELVIDTIAPADPLIALDLLAADDSGSDNTDDITNQSAVTVTVPAGSANAGDIVTVLLDGNSVATSVVAADGSITVSLTGLADGVLPLSYTLTDAAGNTSGSAPVLSVTVDSDAIVPIIDTPIASDDFVNSTEAPNLLLTGTAGSNESVSITITDSESGTVSASTVADAGGVWSAADIDVSGLADGELSVDASAIDAAGNTANASTVTADKDTLDQSSCIERFWCL